MSMSRRARPRRLWRLGAWLGVASGMAFGVSVALAQAVPEVEPNDTAATANLLIVTPGAPSGVRSGTISPGSDVDFYSVAVRKGDFLFVYADGDPERDGSDTDLKVALLGPDGTTVLLTAHSEPTSDAGDFPSESFSVRIAAAGTYFVRVVHATAGTGTYTLKAEILKEPTIATGAGVGGGPHVRTFDGADAAARLSFFAYDPAFSGGVHVAICDLNGDGFPDVLTGAGPGGGPHVRAFNGVTGDQLPEPVGSFFAYDPGFTGGVFVACGDVNGDGVPDVLTGAGPGGGPHVRVLDGVTLAPLAEFFAYAPAFLGGVAVAAGDVNGDGKADVLTGAGPGGGPHVRVLDGVTLAPLAEFFAYAPSFLGGVAVAAGDVNHDGHADLMTGPGPSGAPQVKVFDGVTGAVIHSFFAYDPLFTGGVWLGGD